MQLIDNVNTTVRDAFVRDLPKGSRLSIAAAAFSIYAYRELREQLADIAELRFIFTSPTFTAEKQSRRKYDLVHELRRLKGELEEILG